MLTSHAHLYHQSVLEGAPIYQEKEPWDEYTPRMQKNKRQWVPFKDPEYIQETGFHYGVIPSETGSRKSGHKTHGVKNF